MKNLNCYRYWLEMISVPVFAILVIHLAGHGLMLIKDPDHAHNHDHHVEEGMTEEEGPLVEIAEIHIAEHHEDEPHEEALHEAHLEELSHHEVHDEEVYFLSPSFWLSTEVLGGVLALLLFAWIWHLPGMKKLVPCSHDHCHHKHLWSHFAATAAFVFHFFPESTLRYEMLKEFDWHSFLSVAGAVGFLSHFLVDFIIALLLSSFWSKLWQKAATFILIFIAWVGAFHLGEHGGLHLPTVAEPVILLISAFLLAMFVHRPHKPKVCCDH